MHSNLTVWWVTYDDWSCYLLIPPFTCGLVALHHLLRAHFFCKCLNQLLWDLFDCTRCRTCIHNLFPECCVGSALLLRLIVRVIYRYFDRCINFDSIVVHSLLWLIGCSSWPGILEVDFISACRQIIQVDVSKSDPVAEVLFSNCRGVADLTHEHLSHDLERLASVGIHARVVGVGWHMHVHSFLSRKLVPF